MFGQGRGFNSVAKHIFILANKLIIIIIIIILNGVFNVGVKMYVISTCANQTHPTARHKGGVCLTDEQNHHIQPREQAVQQDDEAPAHVPKVWGAHVQRS